MATQTIEFDTAKSNAFADSMLDTLNKGSLALMTSVGHRSGLLDTLAKMPPSPSDEIAKAAGLNERYVREWLGGMVTAGVVEYDPRSSKYWLPVEHAAFLTRSASPNNLAAFTQYIGMFGTVEEKILDCFKNGGGVPYSEFPRFQEAMAEDSGQTVLPVLTDQIIPLVDGLPEKLQRGIDVLDVGCGSGLALVLLAETYPNSLFTGVDISQEGLERGRQEAARRGVTNVRFEQRDASSMWFTEQFDLVTTFDAVHDQRDPAATLKEIYRALRRGGDYLMQDIASSSDLENNVDHPLGTFLFTVSMFHCMTVSLADGGAGLGTMWGKELASQMLSDAGFELVSIQQLEHDPQNNFFISKKQ